MSTARTIRTPPTPTADAVKIDTQAVAVPAPATVAVSAPAASPAKAAAPVTSAKPQRKAPPARTTPAKAAAKPAVKPAVKAVTGKSARKSPASPVAKPAAAPVAPRAAVKPLATALARIAADKPAKGKKPKMVRDSFTMPKAEYAVIDELKARAAKLALPVKKSELLRAGVKALAAMNDTALASALGDVPAIKTGRPKGDKV